MALTYSIWLSSNSLLPKYQTSSTIRQSKRVHPPSESYHLKDQASAYVAKKCLTDLSSKIKTTIQPVFISRKLNKGVKVRVVKTATVNQQCLLYKFECNWCDAGYVGYIRGHLHERIDGHKQKSSSICKHYLSKHNSNIPTCLSEQFHVVTKCSNKFVDLIKEMLFIRKLTISKRANRLIRLIRLIIFPHCAMGRRLLLLC